MAMTVLFLFRFFAFCVLQRKYVNKKKNIYLPIMRQLILLRHRTFIGFKHNRSSLCTEEAQWTLFRAYQKIPKVS